jgi:hypothetical protein
VRLRTFPDLSVKDFAVTVGGKSPIWSLGAVQLRSAADLTVDVTGKPLVIDQLTGSASFDGRAWRLTKVSGQSLGGNFVLDGIFEMGTLRQSTMKISKVRLEQLSPWIGAERASLSGGLLSLDYRGILSAEPTQLNGSGSVQVENAPLVSVPLLDQAYDLFGAVIPGVNRSGTGEMTASFSVAKGVVDFPKFTATGSSISVTANGTVDLARREVSARAWGNLRGVAGLATLAVSRTLEMKVSGSLDDIRVQPAGPIGIVGGTISEAAKVTEGVIGAGVRMPLKIFDLFKKSPRP